MLFLFEKNMEYMLQNMTINTQDFWKIMFDELDKTSQKDWKKFVKKHDKKYKKKKLKK